MNLIKSVKIILTSLRPSPSPIVNSKKGKRNLAPGLSLKTLKTKSKRYLPPLLAQHKNPFG